MVFKVVFFEKISPRPRPRCYRTRPRRSQVLAAGALHWPVKIPLSLPFLASGNLGSDETGLP